MKREIGFSSLISSLVMMIIGVILINNSEMLVNTIAWMVGCLLILAGIFRSILSYRNQELNSMSLYFSIILLIVGILLIAIPSIVNVMIKIVFGAWILFAGVERLVLAMTMKMMGDNKSCNTFLITSLLIIVLGILVLINLYDLIGWFLIIYAVMDIINYVYYTVKRIDLGTNNNKKKKTKPAKKSRISKEIKDKKAIEADIEEQIKGKFDFKKSDFFVN